MHAGPMIRKVHMKRATWISAYENWNVDIGLECGLQEKLRSGRHVGNARSNGSHGRTKNRASAIRSEYCLGPSPTAATACSALPQLMYFLQNEMKGSRRNTVDEILEIPLRENPNWSPEVIQQELDSNAQSILGMWFVG